MTRGSGSGTHEATPGLPSPVGGGDPSNSSKHLEGLVPPFPLPRRRRASATAPAGDPATSRADSPLDEHEHDDQGDDEQHNDDPGDGALARFGSASPRRFARRPLPVPARVAFRACQQGRVGRCCHLGASGPRRTCPCASSLRILPDGSLARHSRPLALRAAGRVLISVAFASVPNAAHDSDSRTCRTRRRARARRAQAGGPFPGARRETDRSESQNEGGARSQGSTVFPVPHGEMRTPGRG